MRHGDHEHRVPAAEVSPGDVVSSVRRERAGRWRLSLVLRQSIRLGYGRASRLMSLTVQCFRWDHHRRARSMCRHPAGRRFDNRPHSHGRGGAIATRAVNASSIPSRCTTPRQIAIAAAVAVLPPPSVADWAGWLYRARPAGDCLSVRTRDLNTGIDRRRDPAAARSGVLIKGGVDRGGRLVARAR